MVPASQESHGIQLINSVKRYQCYKSVCWYLRTLSAGEEADLEGFLTQRVNPGKLLARVAEGGGKPRSATVGLTALRGARIAVGKVSETQKLGL